MSENRETRSVAGLSQGLGICILLVHCYLFCYPYFDARGWTSKITDRVLAAVIRTGLYDAPWKSKALALIFLLLGVAAGTRRKQPSDQWTWSLAGLLFVMVVYLDMPLWKGISYAVVTIWNVLLILYATSRLCRHLDLPWATNDPFGRRRLGFPQEGRRLKTTFGLCLRGVYLYKGRKRKTYINIVNPRRGILILGTPGSGKSYFIIEPLIRQVIEKGMALFVYDFKYDALTRVAYAHWLANRARYPAASGFYAINFTDLTRSHRCNVLDADTLHWLSDAMGVSRTILLSLNKIWIGRQGDFFIESSINFLAALIWFLKRYENGVYCTLPHVIELSKLSYDKLFLVLETECEIAGLIEPFVQAYTNESLEQLDGQIATVKIPLARLSSPDIYYVLTGSDLSLDINNPAAPKILCLGGDSNRSEALAPVLSLYVDRLNRICNQPKQHPCALVCDEFATIRASVMLTTVATGRSNDIIPIIAIQDISQLRGLYTRDEADWLMAVSGNLFCGQVGGETAKLVADRFPRLLQQKESVSVGDDHTTVSRNLAWEAAVTPATVAGLGSGEFMGMLGDDPDVEMFNKGFHAKIIREDDAATAAKADIMIVREVSQQELQDAFSRVALDINRLVAKLMAELMSGAE
jgi:hypothetical protein